MQPASDHTCESGCARGASATRSVKAGTSVNPRPQSDAWGPFLRDTLYDIPDDASLGEGPLAGSCSLQQHAP